MMVVVSLTEPSATARGLMRNILCEVQPGVFVGSLNGAQIKDVVYALERLSVRGIVAIPAPRTIAGVRIKQLGAPAVGGRRVVEFDGVQLVLRNQQVR